MKLDPIKATDAKRKQGPFVLKASELGAGSLG
jgi:hypothetical protein